MEEEEEEEEEERCTNETLVDRDVDDMEAVEVAVAALLFEEGGWLVVGSWT